MYAFLATSSPPRSAPPSPPAAPRGRAGTSSSVADAAAAGRSVAAPTVDGWAAGALFDAVAARTRPPRADELLGALAPAWGKTRRSRRAWIGTASTTSSGRTRSRRASFALLDKIGEGSAQDDVLGLVDARPS